MGKLERATIYVLKQDGATGTKTDAESTIEVCFNPKEYALDKAVAWDSEKAFADAPQPEFTKPSAMSLSVTLQFDTYEERVSVREKYVKYIEALSMMRKQPTKAPSKNDKKNYSPPVILFVWGRFTFKGVVESLSQKYTMFLADGTPVRAECGLKIRNVIDLENGDDKNNKTQSQAAAATKSYPVQAKDRLDSIAAEQLGDASRWIEIAVLNDIDDPLTDIKGRTLQIPSS